METLTFLGLFVFFREVDTYYAPPSRRGIKQWCCLTSVCRVRQA